MPRIAIAQTPGTRIDEWQETLTRVEEMIARAGERGAEIVVLPECVWPAYLFADTDDYFRARRTGMPSDHDFLERVRAAARTAQVGVCVGYVAEHGDRLQNAASLIAPDGALLGTHRKCFLWDDDHRLFEPGFDVAAFATGWGPVGMMICADARLPEIPGTLASRGAQAILQPTAWVRIGPGKELWNPQPHYLIPERAREFGIPIASCSKWGRELDTTFVGSSVICNAAGEVVARCGAEETALAVADVDFAAPRRARLSEADRARLCATSAPELPGADVPDLRLMWAGTLVARRDIATEVASASSGSRGATLLVGLGSGTTAVDAEAATLRVYPPGDATARDFEVAGIRVATLPNGALESFGPIRAATLDGAHVVVAFTLDGAVAERLVRCRATENRVFLVVVEPARMRVFDPRGEEVGQIPASGAERGAESGAGERELAIVARNAADKEFAPRTNAVLGRTPAAYSF